MNTKYKIHDFGKYHKGVVYCPHCRFDVLNSNSSLYDNIIGFANTRIGTLCVIECPECFEKWSFHANIGFSPDAYVYFLEAIEAGTQKHFKL